MRIPPAGKREVRLALDAFGTGQKHTAASEASAEKPAEDAFDTESDALDYCNDLLLEDVQLR